MEKQRLLKNLNTVLMTEYVIKMSDSEYDSTLESEYDLYDSTSDIERKKYKFTDYLKKKSEPIEDSKIKAEVDKLIKKLGRKNISIGPYSIEGSFLRTLCYYSDFLPLIDYFVKQFKVYVAENKYLQYSLDDETLWYTGFGKGQGPIYYAISGERNVDIIRYLADQGFSTDGCINMAVHKNNLPILKYLIEEKKEKLSWSLDEECGNPYIYAKGEIKKYIYELGIKTKVGKKYLNYLEKTYCDELPLNSLKYYY